MTIQPRVLTASVVAAAAGIRAATLSAWHARHELLNDTKPEGSTRRYGIGDAVEVRLIALLTAHGITVSKAIEFVTFWRGTLFPLHGDSGDNWFILFRRGATDFTVSSGSESLADLMRDMDGVVTVIDLRSVVGHVIKVLGLTAVDPDAGAA